MRNKRKGILMASAILGSAAIVSTGFAAWVITVNESTEAVGQIEVDTVEDERIILKAQPFADDQVIKFGTKSTEGFDSPWLTVRDAVNEKLVVTTTMSITGAEFLDEENPFDISIVEVNGSAYTAAASKNYVAKLDKSMVKIDFNDASKTTATITVTFAWGTYFGEVNPTDFYNSFSYNSYRKDILTTDDTETKKLDESKVTDRGDSNTLTMADDASEVLAEDGVFGSLNGAQFKITIAPVRSTNSK